MPPVKVQPHEKSILSFDPGLTTMGWAFSTYDPATSKFTNHKIGSFFATRYATKQKQELELVEKRVLSCQFVRSEVNSLLQQFEPDYVATEASFTHHRSPQAGIVLSLCIMTVRMALYDRYKQLPAAKVTAARLYEFPPMTVKLCTSGNGHCGKLGIQEAISANNDIEIRSKDISLFSEHEADALAVGYTFARHCL